MKRLSGGARVIVIGEWSPPAHNDGAEWGPPYVITRCPPRVRALQRAVAGGRVEWLLVGTGTAEDHVRMLVRAARMSWPDLRLAILGNPDDRDRCQRWQQQGCMVYLNARSTAAQVLMSLRLADEQNWVVTDRSFWDTTRKHHTQPLTSLTRRESEVLRLVRRGFRNTDIAEQLGLATSTVEFHVGNVLQKLGARNRADAVSRAVELGL